MRKKNQNHLTDQELEEEMKSWDTERASELIKSSLKERRITIKCKSKTQKEVIKQIEEKDISIVIGPPGTGKTYLSCAKALKLLKDDPFKYKKIVLIKSVNAPKDEEIGYLKGTLQEKMEMYVYPFMSNFEKVIGK